MSHGSSRCPVPQGSGGGLGEAAAEGQLGEAAPNGAWAKRVESGSLHLVGRRNEKNLNGIIAVEVLCLYRTISSSCPLPPGAVRRRCPQAAFGRRFPQAAAASLRI